MSVYTETQLTSDHSPRTRSVGGVVLHHGATTSLEVIIGLMKPGGRTVSAHAAIQDGRIVQAVPSNRRAWSLGDAYWDSWAMTAECANNAGAPSWTLSAKTHESIAQFVAASAKEFGFHPHRNGDPKNWTVIGHREVYTIHGGSYATACPGGMDLAWITKRAQQILSGNDASDLPGIPGSAGSGGGSSSATWAGYKIVDIQKRLNKHGAKLAVDGIYGPATTAAVRVFQKSKGLAVDGDVGPKTWAELQKDPSAKKPSSEKPKGDGSKPAPGFPLPPTWWYGYQSGPIQSVSGRHSNKHGTAATHQKNIARFQRRMIERGWLFPKYGADGIYGDELNENTVAFQKEKGLTVDGKIGPKTWRAAWTEPIT